MVMMMMMRRRRRMITIMMGMRMGMGNNYSIGSFEMITTMKYDSLDICQKKHKNGNYAVPNTQRGIWMWTRMWLSRMNFPVWGMAMMATMCAKERPRHGSHAVPKNKSNMQQLLQTSLWIGGSKVHVRTWLGLKNRFICLEEENSAKARKTEVADATFRDIQLGRGVTIYIAKAWQGCNGSSDCLFQVPRSWWARNILADFVTQSSERNLRVLHFGRARCSK